ncbi:MAG: hypothetical protein RLZZ618_3647 [Pseudomonadota bacterium]|jgi:uncharacterized protein (TIGR00369 family)
MKFQRHIPFVEMLGFELLKFEAGEAEIAVELRDELCNSWSVAHGGLTMTLLDVAMAHAARSPAPGETDAKPAGVVTIEMKTSFMRPGLGRLVAKARLLHGTASLAFCEASVVDAKGALVAQATGTFKYLSGLPAGGRTIKRPNASD